MKDHLTFARPIIQLASQVISGWLIADEIVTIEGLDSLVVGPYDLSGSMGMLGQVHHPRVLDAIRTVAEKAKAAGLYIGMGMGADADHALEAATLGVQWAQCGNDFEFMIRSTDQLFDGVRERLSQL